MIVDSSILSRHDQSFDLIVIGGGAAGLTLAQAVGSKGLRVLLLEAGGPRETREGRAALSGELAAPAVHPALDLYRTRALGGTSRLWGGRCIPLDRIDFDRRDWIGKSGWPVGYEEIAAYYPAAMTAAEAGANEFDPASVFAGSRSELAAGLDGDLVRTTIERFSRPTDFWRRFGIELASSNRIYVLPHTRLLSIRLTSNGSVVEKLVVADRAGRQFLVRASTYVLALGGLEATRVLLASRDVKPGGIGNDFDQLGRYYMSHFCANGGTLDMSSSPAALAFDYQRDSEGIYLRRRLWLTETSQRLFRLPNITFRTHLPDPGDPAHRNAILSAMFLSKSFVQKEYAAKFSEGMITRVDYLRHARNIAVQPAALSRFAAMWLRRRILTRRKLPSVVLASADHRYPLEFHAEQLPNSDSRVTLSERRDADDVPRLKVDWRVLDADVEGIVRAHRLLKREVERTGIGHLSVDEAALSSCIRDRSIVGGHHIGTTRMSVTPQHGVVDPDCRVHGVDNLFIASSSVMPTSGQANPTLTILALALRLADHLHMRSRSTAAGSVDTSRRAAALR
ncbi:FAD dependent oxidoreductase [Bradyrhizobium sp. ORS 375]|uniref:GMC oxidoreductase n=1 Tax=Bradyrhizobium sp. (strain ORS 375) TaxID=566679 RepID=UPI000240598B|nr:GMC family oxidoreductase [Bradyrhizobium sp. ORS 375]CCD95833.1 FAD dependent oxidoreductase [Bradyrhizobium sp. ORS 375]